MYATQTTDISHAVRVLEEGRIVAFPTGTAYGLAVNALSGHALQRLRNLKKRPKEKTFSIFVSQSLWDTYLDLTEEEKDILHTHANKALTLLVHPKQPLNHLAQDGYIGLRVIDHPLMEQLADAAKIPLTATSANVSGQAPTYSPADILAVFPGKEGTTYDLSLGCILDGGSLEQKDTSTVARYAKGEYTIIRQGSLRLS